MKKITYSDAGVDIKRGDNLVKRIKQMVSSRAPGEDLSGIGSFGSLFLPKWGSYREPVLVTGVDGVGTKLLLAQKTGNHRIAGIDLVAMSVNDILVHGASPLLFFDYIATGKIEEETLLEVIGGIEEGCSLAGCSLAGGETAEMPDFYSEGKYDLAGFCLGLVEKEEVITGKEIKPGDKLVGISSSGLHSNGFSLARKLLFGELKLTGREKITDDITLMEEIIKPTRIYVEPVLALLQEGIKVNGMSHITGGGIGGNLSRVLPDDCVALIKLNSWPDLPLYSFIKESGLVELPELFKTFNMGIGFILVLPDVEVERTLEFFEKQGEKAFVIGEIIKKSSSENMFKTEYEVSFKDKKVFFIN